MEIYEVRGTVTIEVLKRVKAKDEYAAIELAKRYFNGLEGYCGNGGYDKLIGVCEESESVQLCGDSIDWHEAQLTDDDRYDREASMSFKYVCKLCGEEFEYENKDDFENNDAWDFFDHFETEHEELFALCENWTNTQFIDEFFEREDD
jgi:hypothetical protein